MKRVQRFKSSRVKVYIILVLSIVFGIIGCSRDRNPLEDETVPGTPVVKAESGRGGIILSWDQCENAQKYVIYKSEKSGDEFKTEAPLFWTTTEFTDNSVVEGHAYRYIVAAITKGGLEGYDSDPVIIEHNPPKIAIFSPKEPQKELKLLDFMESGKELSFIAKNEGVNEQKWSVKSQEKWLTFSPESGQILPKGGTVEIKVSVDRKSLQWGENKARVSVAFSDYIYDFDVLAVKAGILGAVMDSRKNAPMDRAQVSVNGETQTTSSNGEFAFVIPKFGKYKLSASKDDKSRSRYISAEKEVEFKPESPVIRGEKIQLKGIPYLAKTMDTDLNMPTYIAFSRDGARAYITNNSGNNVTVVDASNDTVAAKEVTVKDKPLGIAANPMKDEVYVANNWSDNISVIETKTNRNVADIADVGKFPTCLVVSPDGKWLYSVGSRSNDVSVIDTDQRLSKEVHIPVGADPYGIAITPDGAYLYVTNSKDGTVSVIDTKQPARKIGSITVGQNPSDIIVSPDGRQVYVSAGRLVVIDTSTNKVIREHKTGADPWGFGLIVGIVYIVVRMNDKVELFDPTQNMIVQQSIDVGKRPRGIATNGKKVYVANSLDNTVSVLEFP